MDDLDEKIMRLLRSDAHQSGETLSKKLGVTAATIRRRIRELLRRKILRIVGLVDPNKIGFPLAAVIAFDVEQEKLESVVKMLANRPEVVWVSTTTGRFDIIALVRFRATDELAAFMQKEMRQSQGFRDSETFICLHVAKGRYVPMYLDPDTAL